MLEDLTAHCNYVYFRSEKWWLILRGSAESVACYACDTALAAGPDPKPAAIKQSKVMSPQQREVVIVACPRITLGSLSLPAWELTLAKCVAENYQNTKASNVGWWCLLEPMSLHRHKQSRVCDQPWATTAPWHLHTHVAPGHRGIRTCSHHPACRTLWPGPASSLPQLPLRALVDRTRPRVTELLSQVPFVPRAG